MSKFNTLPLLVILSFFAFTSCDSSMVHETYVDYDNAIWPLDSIASFDIEVENIERNYNLYSFIRNTNDYPFQNIYIKYSLVNADSIQPDTLINERIKDFQLFEVKTGEPFGKVEHSLGNSSTGAIYTHPLLIKKGFQFPSEGTYNLKIQHYMRPNLLEGIIGVGYRLEFQE